MLTLLVVKVQVDSNEENIRIAFRYLNALIFPFATIDRFVLNEQNIWDTLLLLLVMTIRRTVFVMRPLVLTWSVAQYDQQQCTEVYA
jgi:hypothetical protein